MANTRETLGDQTTVDALVSHSPTLTSFEEDGVVSLRNYVLANQTHLTRVKFPAVTSVGQYAFQNCTGLTQIAESDFPATATINNYAFEGCTGLESVTLPKVTSVGQYAFQGCTELETVDLANTATMTINANSFNGDTLLKHLIVRSSAMSTLSSTNALTGTKIAKYEGAVYVDDDIVSNYENNNYWKTYFILPISSYPASDSTLEELYDVKFSTITDSWATIIANNSDYATKYPIGGTKVLNMGSFGKVIMELVAVNADTKTSGGTARMTWIAKDCLSTTHRMNATNTNANGWPNTEMRTWLRETVLPEFPQAVRNAIVEVNKTYYDYTSKSTKTQADTIWLPSMREIFGGTSYESDGVIYSDKFKDANSRKKNLNGSASSWWTRSADSSNSQGFWGVNSSGSSYYYYASGAYGVAPGFCL